MVDRNRRAACRIHPNADDLRRVEIRKFLGRLCEGSARGRHQAVQVVLRVLPGHMRVLFVQQNTHLPGWIVKNHGTNFRAVS